MGAHLKVHLVDYLGPQPQGFDVASVPQGFGLQTQVSNAFSFVLARPGVNEQPDNSGATQLWFTVGNGVVADVQAWDSIGLTDQQLIKFAGGITTTPALQLSHG